ncbi:hypothetical protein [Streptacidiphilus sp. EB129]|jgi:hypothetical protein|uniref:hypothetical protein n=1 Tax=Streptacidiphilus sp. EB129 TaxID=3156262 RepID=UPI003518808C
MSNLDDFQQASRLDALAEIQRARMSLDDQLVSAARAGVHPSSIAVMAGLPEPMVRAKLAAAGVPMAGWAGADGDLAAHWD